MLKHMIDRHKGEDFKEVKWGMFVIKFLRSAFERQIEEAVKIEKISKEGEILNSKSEYNNCNIPRLVTRVGNTEKEIKEYEKELRIEKEKDEKLEKEIRTMRKERNRARLITEKNHRPTKRMKTDEGNYISIRKVWGYPKPTAPEKKRNSDDVQVEKRNDKKRKIEIGERLSNIQRVEDKVYEGEEIRNFTIEKTDWDKVLREHRERLENETLEREKEIEKQQIEEKSWELYRECQQFLETNEKNWEKSRIERENEKKRIERLELARIKQENLKMKIQTRKLEEDIKENLEKLPTSKRKEIEAEEKRKRKIELANMKKTIWKLRRKQKNVREKTGKK